MLNSVYYRIDGSSSLREKIRMGCFSRISPRPCTLLDGAEAHNPHYLTVGPVIAIEDHCLSDLSDILRDLFPWHCGRVQKKLWHVCAWSPLISHSGNTVFSYIQGFVMAERLALVKSAIVRLEWLHACKAWIVKARAAVSTIKYFGIERLYPHPSEVSYKVPGVGTSIPIG